MRPPDWLKPVEVPEIELPKELRVRRKLCLYVMPNNRCRYYDSPIRVRCTRERAAHCPFRKSPILE